MGRNHRTHTRRAGPFTLLALGLGLPVACAAQQPELLWTYDTKG